MRNLLVVLGFFAFVFQSRAQLAPDFTVTDTDGQVHHLYADYLNQGKSVMIKIMFTTCPPCNSIAPLMEPLYQDWGAGDYDVEFFEMTDKSFDTNALMEAYANQYNETFPAISFQGNAIPTVQPYKSGTFGPWFGTPTFVVIAPDGTVQFNVDGANNQATIAAIDAALTATGALKPNQVPVAPDFTVTDSHGELHHLYADYLDQGKTVLLEIFSTTCSPCISIAPLMEPFYQEWRAGEYDVEFFEMSDKTFDTDALVNAYQDEYGETFVGVSNDGGSVAAVAPYKNGQFGPWLTTPTFIVIAPDGTVQYDVDGPNNQATIDAIDAALLATGAEKPVIEQPVLVSGGVQFLQGSLGIGNAYVQVLDANNNIMTADTTNANGEFDLEILMSEVLPGWKVKVVKQGTPLNGVSVIDLVKMQKHLLLIEPFDNPFSKLASDVNKSGNISSLDIVGLLKIILGRVPTFSDGETWIVVPADTDFGVPTQNPPVIGETTILLEDILSGARLPQWIGIKKGDANGNADPTQ